MCAVGQTLLVTRKVTYIDKLAEDTDIFNSTLYRPKKETNRRIGNKYVSVAFLKRQKKSNK